MDFWLGCYIGFLVFSAIACSLQHWSQSRSDDAEEVTVPASVPQQQESLSAEDRDNFFHLWSSIQDRFGENAETAVLHADMLLFDLMHEYGWDDEDLPQGADRLRSTYTSAHGIAARVKQDHIPCSELERAMKCYGLVVAQILGSARAAAPLPCWRSSWK
jgi:hypothetical protein